MFANRFTPNRSGKCLTSTLFGAALALILSMSFPQSSAASDFFVHAANGSDATGDGTRGNPWQTLGFALSQVTGPNNTILVGPGTYDEGLGEVFPLSMVPGVSVVAQDGFRTTRIQGPSGPVGGDSSDGVFRPMTDIILDTDVQSVFNFAEVFIEDGVRVEVRGSLPLIMNVVGDVVIDGVLDLSADNGNDGTAGGGSDIVLGGLPGAGGSRGGNANDPEGTGPTRGEDGVHASGTTGGGQGGERSTSSPGGGGGGGHVTVGSADVAMTSGAGGMSYGDDQLTTLFGGSGGGAGGNSAGATPAEDDTGGSGGAGGGAILINARGIVRIAGRLKAEGGNGGMGGGAAGGGAGGSGGSIRVSASSIELAVDARILARGGQRGEPGPGVGGRPGGAGADGRIRFEDSDGLVDVSQSFVAPAAIEAFLAPSTSPDIVLFPSGSTFTPDTRFVGFTVAGGNRGIFVDSTGMGTIHRPRIKGNALIESEVGIQFNGANEGVCSPLFVSNYVYDNRVGVDVVGEGGGTVQPFVVNDTITINGIGVRVDPAFSGEKFTALQNSLVWQNGVDLAGLILAEVLNCNITVSDFVGENGNTSLPPRFVDKQTRDLRLDPLSSSLIDLGEMNVLGLDGLDPDGEPRHYDFDGDGLRQPDVGADETGLARFMLRYGAVNSRQGETEDALFINGQVGDSSRRILPLPQRTPFVININTSSAGPSIAPWVLYAFVGEPSNTTISRLPLELGTFTFPTPLTGASGGVFTLVNNVIHNRSKAALGCGLINALDAPSSVGFDRGIGVRAKITFQAILVDFGSENGVAGVTNAIVLDQS